MKQKFCLICNQELTGHQRKCCSNKCAKDFKKLKLKKKLEENKLNLDLKRKTICIVCQKEFEYIFRKDRGERKFCGRSCASKFYIQDGTFDKWRLRKNDLLERFTRNCVMCNKEIEVMQNHIKIHEKFDMAFCCSSECRIKYTSKINSELDHAPMSSEAKEKQLATLYKNHGVTNAFMLAKRRTITKPQRNIFNWLVENYPDYEFQIEKRVINSQKELFADIVSFKHNLVIEFYGDFWHCHSNKYADDFIHPVKRQTAKEIREWDSQRINELQKAGFIVNIIWEIDYNLNNWKVQLQEWIKIYEEKNIDA